MKEKLHIEIRGFLDMYISVLRLSENQGNALHVSSMNFYSSMYLTPPAERPYLSYSTLSLIYLYICIFFFTFLPPYLCEQSCINVIRLPTSKSYVVRPMKKFHGENVQHTRSPHRGGENGKT